MLREPRHPPGLERHIIERRVIAVEGLVQGVGFRPYVHRLATARSLNGFVRNEPSGVLIEVQGPVHALDDFLAALTADPPPLAMIHHVRAAVAETDVIVGFSIVDGTDPAQAGRTLPAAGSGQPAVRTLVSPDVATCEDCLDELFDSRDRRYGYPFINCTHCGPRLTIVEDVPYDRPNTTMARFAMCDLCREEYEDPANRRFHAQPIACPACGPSVQLVPTDGSHKSTGEAALVEAIDRLKRGGILAIKGLGGYHVACDAGDAEAVRALRKRKHREARPFAIMVRDAAAARELCHVSSAEFALITSRERPILLLDRMKVRDSAMSAALEESAPGTPRLGVMLPYTPLHHLLLRGTARPLVMTSGNLSDEPIAFEDADANARLAPIVDAVLSHDRPITTRCDDSVMAVVREAPVFLRRSRGFAPRPIETRVSFPKHVLAVGGQLKNTFCLARDKSAFMSHHIGDLENPMSRDSLVRGIRHYSRLVGVDPEVVVHDLHPGYTSTVLAAALALERRVAVQHHHAHIASCMAEHGLTDSVIGVAFDGAGLGEDGAIWGGEFLVVDSAGYQRVGQLGYVPLPGGDAAARRPDRMAIAHLWSAFGEEMTSLPTDLARRMPAGELSLIRQMLAKSVNSPPTSSVGRLFDAVAALAGVRDVAQFEGQAAMELEAIADAHSVRSYPVDIAEAGPLLIADPGSMVRAVAADLHAGIDAAGISAAFHNGLARMILDMAQEIRQRTGVNGIALSGGVFQNVLLHTRSVAALEGAGFEVFTQRLVPCNDGGLSLGQAYVVALRDGEV